MVFHSLTLVISGVFLMGLALTGEVFRRGGAEWGHVAEVSLLCAGVVTIAVLLTSGSMRSRMRGVLVDNFFSNRYDYRREWMRCIDTLTAPDAFVGLHKRAIRAVARGGRQPGGRAVRAGAGGCGVSMGGLAQHAGGNRADPARPSAGAPHSPMATASRCWRNCRTRPSWFEEIPRAWLAVPLNHFGNLIGFVVLARSRAPFRLDREVFQLLRVVGREVASRVAEQRAAQILSQTRELRDYSQRFAFVLHDIKNVSGQLSMLLANAEVHADNPEFQRDMLATVRASVGKITRLLSRLQADRQERSHALIDPVERLKDIVATPRSARQVRRRVSRLSARTPIATLIVPGGVAIDAEAFDAVAAHLLNNAIEASPPGPAGARRGPAGGAERGHRHHR